jgi:PAS domain S-box-containing protein
VPAIDLQSFVDTQKQPFLVVDENFRVVAVNAPFERAHGASRDRVVGQRCHCVSHGSPTPCGERGEDCPLQRLRRSRSPVPYSCTHVHRDGDGRVHHVQVNAVPLQGADGTFYMGESLHELLVQHPREGERLAMVGRSPVFLEVLEQVQTASRSDVPVLLTGETGTGKELAAIDIHARSPRAAGPFVTLDCTVLNDNLFESELFGHERGAFTGGLEMRKGLFELADGGTLFLDEIGELSLAAQAKLLRAVETLEFRRLGGRRTLHADVRIVCATNRDVVQGVRDGVFRSDLFYRIACLWIRLPSLRERMDDVPELAATILLELDERMSRSCELDAAALELLHRHDFPGNIRELRNVLMAAAAYAAHGRIRAAHIARVLSAARPPHAPERAPAEVRAERRVPSSASLWELEARHIARMLRRHGGSRRRVAAELGISERTLYRKIKRYALR